MSVAPATSAPKEMSVEEFLALPDDGVSRELIRGQLKERGMTIRNRFHCDVEVNIAFELENWLRGQPKPRGKIVSGEAGFRLRGTRDSVVGIDVAFASAELVMASGPEDRIFNGPPVLAVEILSPSDTQEDIVEMIQLYLEAGVVVWVVDTDFPLVRIHRPGQIPVTLNRTQEIAGDPELAGLRIPVAAFFED
ncbi:MAG: Uma2 family endonuclease [Isosphaeraceae bacterium]|nr:Uma2 family endonuclease [Isosphaeraceae bacterium]